MDVVIITHPHEDHMGSAAELGVEAQLYAHSGTAAAMAEPYVFMEGVSIPPKPASAQPDTRVDTEMSIDFGGDQIRLLPTVAHTAGDLSVYFTDARVAHLGDAFLFSNPMMYPGTVDPDAFLDRLEGFASHHGPDFYGLPRNTDRLTLRKQDWQIPDSIPFGGEALTPLRAGESMTWTVHE